MKPLHSIDLRLAALWEMVAARGSRLARVTMISATVLSFALSGARAVAVPNLDPTTPPGLFRALSTASGHQVTGASLAHVSQPASDPHTKTLWRRLSRVARMRDAWILRDGVVIRGSTPDRAPFDLIARALPANAARIGIALPDDVTSPPMRLRSFRSHGASFALFYANSMSRYNQRRVLSAALGARL